MRIPLKRYTADHRYLLEAVGRYAGMAKPVAIRLDAFQIPLLKASRRGAILPVDGVLVRDWHPDSRRLWAGVRLGMRLYEIEGIRFVLVEFQYSEQLCSWGHDFAAVDAKDYRALYRIAVRCRRDDEP